MLQGKSHVSRGPILLLGNSICPMTRVAERSHKSKKKRTITPRIVSLGRLWFGETWNGKNGLLNSICSSILLQLLGILVLSRWRNIYIQAPHIQNPVRFRRFNIVQTSRSWGQHLCSKFAKIPHLWCPRTFKVPTSSCGPPPLGHNIDSCIILPRKYFLFVTVERTFEQDCFSLLVSWWLWSTISTRELC